jgi:predicted nucleic acid-binding protein
VKASVVIDASITAAWFLPGEQTDYTEALFERVSSAGFEVIAPRLWAYEIRNTVLMAFRRGRITKIESQQILVSLNNLSVDLSEPASYDDLFALAQARGLTVYDAAYLAVALRQELPLASLDRQLIRAAAEVSVKIYQA